jgi:hypothetical protein
MAGLDITKAVRLAFDERNTSEIDANRANTAPLPSKIFCDVVADEYDKWFRTLQVGFMHPVPSGLEALKTNLRSFYFTTWGTAFLSYWQTTVWPPDTIGLYLSGVFVNAPIAAAQLQSEINNLLFSEQPKSMLGSPDAFAERIAEIISTYTTKLQVQAVLSIPPYTTTEFVVESF